MRNKEDEVSGGHSVDCKAEFLRKGGLLNYFDPKKIYCANSLLRQRVAFFEVIGLF